MRQPGVGRILYGMHDCKTVLSVTQAYQIHLLVTSQALWENLLGLSFRVFAFSWQTPRSRYDAFNAKNARNSQRTAKVRVLAYCY
jgi:hypothetical protein